MEKYQKWEIHLPSGYILCEGGDVQNCYCTLHWSLVSQNKYISAVKLGTMTGMPVEGPDNIPHSTSVLKYFVLPSLKFFMNKIFFNKYDTIFFIRIHTHATLVLMIYGYLLVLIYVPYLCSLSIVYSSTDWIRLFLFGQNL